MQTSLSDSCVNWIVASAKANITENTAMSTVLGEERKKDDWK